MGLGMYRSLGSIYIVMAALATLLLLWHSYRLLYSALNEDRGSVIPVKPVKNSASHHNRSIARPEAKRAKSLFMISNLFLALILVPSVWMLYLGHSEIFHNSMYLCW